ncbi:hypothetical protein GCM10027423_14930 [Spirosoma arcticum]
MLSEGPLLASPQNDEELWTLRRNWLMAQFGDRLQEDTYEEKVVAEFARICRYAEYDEVIFWFEHDLFCQINLVFLLACFARVDLGQTVLKQVSINQFAGISNFKGLGQLTGVQLATLYPQAEPLTVYELTLVVRVWKAYATPDAAALTELLTENFGRLRYLRVALLAHVARLQIGTNGLPLIENQLLTLIQTSPKTTQQVVTEWLANDHIYGLGDRSIENYIAQLIRQGLVQETDGFLTDVVD